MKILCSGVMQCDEACAHEVSKAMLITAMEFRLEGILDVMLGVQVLLRDAEVFSRPLYSVTLLKQDTARPNATNILPTFPAIILPHYENSVGPFEHLMIE
jgi:hypothetical protein